MFFIGFIVEEVFEIVNDFIGVVVGIVHEENFVKDELRQGNYVVNVLEDKLEIKILVEVRD